MPQKKTKLSRLIVRLPVPVHEQLRGESEAVAVPMAVIVRQLVAEWVAARAREKQGTAA